MTDKNGGTMRSWLSLLKVAALCIGAAPFAHAAEPKGEVTQGVVLRRVTVVDTHTGALSRPMSVVIADGKIVEITPKTLRVGAAAKEVDGTGKYLVPGFVDTHIHSVQRADRQVRAYPLLVANGVTQIREETITPETMDRGARDNADRAAGKIVAPEVVFAGGEQHLNPNLSALEQSNAGMPSMDHLGAGWGLIRDCSTDEAAIRDDARKVVFRPPPNYPMNPRAFDAPIFAPFYQRILDTYSEAKCEALAEAFVRNNTWQTVTLIRLKVQDWGNDPRYRNDPNLKYMDRETIAQWNAFGDRFAAVPASAVKTLQAYYGLQKRVTGMMYRKGVPILAGSDSGVWSVPGFALQQEFRELASAGLPPLAVLQAATLNPARFFNREATMGAVEVGKNADLVLLDGNPIKSVDALSRISGVVVAGRYLSRRELETLKAGVAAAGR